MNTRTDLAERIMVALDVPHPSDAKELLVSLAGIPCYMKVGMQLFYMAGPQFILMLKEKGYRVFLDLKMHDIPNTVRGGAASITSLGVDMFNIHAAGGFKMMEAAIEGVEDGLVGRNGLSRPTVVAVTQLTSTSLKMLNKEVGIEGTVAQSVERYARLARQAGLQGVVASAQEVATIKRACGDSFLTVTPGIRPKGAAANDQARVMTPKEAFAAGTDYIVIGRPITKAPDPREALESIIEELI